MQILNIDSFATITRQISFAGKTYPVEEVNLQQFIDNLKAAETLEASENSEDTLLKSFEQAVTAIRQSIPTFPESELMKLKLPAIHAIMSFIRGEMDPEVNPPTNDGAGDSAEKKSD